MSQPSTPLDNEINSESSSKPRRGWLRYLLVAAIVCAIVILLLPTLVLRTPIRDKVLAYALSDFPGQVQVDKLTMGWFAPLSATDVSVDDEQGNAVARIESVTGTKSLSGLLLNRSNLGKFVVTKPQLQVVVRKNGSNVEDLLAPYLETDSATTTAETDAESMMQIPSISLEIIDGLVSVVEVPTNVSWKASNANAVVSIPDWGRLPVDIRAITQIDGFSQSGKLQIKGNWEPNSQPPAPSNSPLGRGDFQLALEQIPLGVAQAGLLRAGYDSQVIGASSGNVTAKWDAAESGQTATITANIGSRGLGIAAPELLGKDAFQVQTVQLTADATLQNQQLAVRKCDINSELGELQLTGQANNINFQHKDWTVAVREFIQRDRFDMSGQIDLAQVAAILPNTLHIREDTTLQAGKIQWQANNTDDGKLFGQIQTADIQAIRNNQPVVWRNPIKASVLLSDSAQGPVVEQLVCQSTFLALTGRGTLQQGRLAAQGDLQRMQAELGQFVDFGATRMQGHIVSDLQWQQPTSDSLVAGGNLKVNNFEVATPNHRPWREEALQSNFEATAKIENLSLQEITKAQIRLESGGDDLQAALTQPVASPSASTAWPIQAQVRGELASWQSRLEPFLPAEVREGLELNGLLNATLVATASPTQAVVESANLDMKRLRGRYDGMIFSEPELQLKTAGRWQQSPFELNFPMTTLNSATVSLRAEKIAVRQNGDNYETAGLVDITGDLQRIWQAGAGPELNESYQPVGKLVGRFQVAHQKNAIVFDGKADIENVSIASKSAAVEPTGQIQLSARSTPTWSKLWEEPYIQIDSQGSYDLQQGKLQLTRCEAKSDAFAVVATGAIDTTEAGMPLDLQGQTQYNLEKLAVRLKNLLGDSVTLSGQQQHSFAIRGPTLSPDNSTSMIPNELQAKAAVGWNSASAYGLQFGPQEINAGLQQGVVRFNPLNLAVGEGQVTLTPNLHLNSQPALIEVPAGRIADNINISPEICQTWMKYVAPLVADAASAQGTFSLDIAQTLVPIFDPTNLKTEGAIGIHGAQIGAGPLAKQFLSLAQQLKSVIKKGSSSQLMNSERPWITLPEQQVQFKVVNGQVEHRNLTMMADDVIIRTSGVVGMDERLSMLAEIPLLDKWLGDNRYLASLRGQTLKIPVTGTLSKPTLDQRAITGLATQMVQGAATGLIQDEVQKQLKKLFK